MTWNDLITRLQEVPEERRNDKAIFKWDDAGVEYEIDNMEPIRAALLEEDVLPDNEQNYDLNVYILTP